METLRFEVSLPGMPGFRADAMLGDTVFEVLLGLKDVRGLQGRLLELAAAAASTEGLRVVCLIADSLVTEDRLFTVWDRARSAIRPEVMERLTLVSEDDEGRLNARGDLSAGEKQMLPAVLRELRMRRSRISRPPTKAFYEVLRVLLVHWVRRTGPLTTRSICHEAGFSYPSTAGALRQLEPCLKRQSDRRVSLKTFPKDGWFKLVSRADEVRLTRRYSDRSGRPRSLDALLARLQELGDGSVAVGGVVGARHYHPGLDMIGTPRLDLVVHAEGGGSAGEIVRRLDPALRPAEEGEPVRVAVHHLYRPVAMFNDGPNGISMADEIECLLDLHDARLEPLALEFLEWLTEQANS